MVRFGDANMRNRSSEPKEEEPISGPDTTAPTAKDKFTARYWSCKDWA